jgi:hypothetical protein
LEFVWGAFAETGVVSALVSVTENPVEEEWGTEEWGTEEASVVAQGARSVELLGLGEAHLDQLNWYKQKTVQAEKVKLILSYKPPRRTVTG